MKPISVRRPADAQSDSSAPPLTPRPETRPARRLARFAPEIIRELPPERLLRIDVNGCFAGTVLAIPDAPRELAAGWAFMHGFFDRTADLGRVSAADDRISIMVASGEDIDRRRLEAVGWAEPNPLPAPNTAGTEPFSIEEGMLVNLIDVAWSSFRRDGGSDGYLHVAAASSCEIHCIARDRTIEMAAAKVLGWMITGGRQQAAPVLLVRGMVDRRLVEAAGRLGVSLIVTSAIPTAEAYRAATGMSLSIVGMALATTLGLLVDGGHIGPESADEPPGESETGP